LNDISTLTVTKIQDLPAFEGICNILSNKDLQIYINNPNKYFVDLYKIEKRLEANPFISQFYGYPQWMQGSEIPSGMGLENFIFQLSFQDQDLDFDSEKITRDGCLYVFKKDKEIKFVYQR
jgi:hypothetical protein